METALKKLLLISGRRGLQKPSPTHSSSHNTRGASPRSFSLLLCSTPNCFTIALCGRIWTNRVYIHYTQHMSASCEKHITQSTVKRNIVQMQTSWNSMDTLTCRHICGMLDCAISGALFSNVHGPQQLKELLLDSFVNSSSSWLHQIFCDLDWLEQILSMGLPDPRTNSSSWYLFVVSDKYLDYVHTAVGKHVPNDRQTHADPIISEIQCELCTRRFPTLAAMRLHQFKIHGVKNKMRNYVEDGNCPVCLKMFHSRVNLLQHLTARSKRCADYITTHFTLLKEAHVQELDASDAHAQKQLKKQGHHRRKCFKSVVQMFGPKLEGV